MNLTSTERSDLEDEDLPSLFPIPLSKDSELIIEMPENWGASTILIYDISGKKIVQISLKLGVNQLKLIVASGAHTAVIINNSKSFTKTLIVE